MRNYTRALLASSAAVPLIVIGAGTASAAIDDIDASALALGPITIVTVSGAQPEAECVTVPPQLFGGTADANGNAFMVLLSDTVLTEAIPVTCIPGAPPVPLLPDFTLAEFDSGSLGS